MICLMRNFIYKISIGNVKKFKCSVQENINGLHPFGHRPLFYWNEFLVDCLFLMMMIYVLQ